MRIVVLGGGFTGAIAAYLLRQQGHDVQIVEKKSAIGGLCRTQEFGGILHEFGPHILYASRGSKAHEFFCSHIQVREKKYRVRVSIDGSLSDLCQLPVTPRDVLRLPECEQIIQELYEASPDSTGQGSFEDHLIARIGKTLYQYFMENYNVKQWGMHPRDMHLEWGRYRNLGLQKSGASMFGDAWQGHPGSYDAFFEKLVAGVDIIQTEVTGAVVSGGRIREIRCLHGEVRADWFVSTIPVEQLLGRDGWLTHRGSCKMFFLLDEENVMRDYLVTFPNTHRFTRIMNYKEQSGQSCGRTLLSFAFPFDSRQRELPLADWRSEAERFIRENFGSMILDHRVEMERHAYPVSEQRNLARLRCILEQASEIDNLITVGRNGLHSYTSMVTCLEQCFQLVENIEEHARRSPKERLHEYERVRATLR